MRLEIGGLAAWTGDELAAECAAALELPRQPAFQSCLDGFMRDSYAALGHCAVLNGLAGTGKQTLMRQMAGSLSGSALIRAVSPEADTGTVGDLYWRLRKDSRIENFFYENATDLPNFVRGAKVFTDLHAGHVVLSGDGTYSFFLAAGDRLLFSIYWFDMEPVLRSVSDMEAWIDCAVVENIRQGARLRLYTDDAFGIGPVARLEEQGRLADAIRAELFGRDAGLDSTEAWAVRNTLLAAGVYEQSGGWKVECFRDEWPWSLRPDRGRPRCLLPELQAHVEGRRAEALAETGSAGQDANHE